VLLQLLSGTAVYGKIESGKPIIVSKRTIALIAVLALSGSLAAPATIAAQQLVAANFDPMTLPEAPTPQPSVLYSSSIQAQQQTMTPAESPAPAQTDTRSASQKALDQEEHQRMLGVIPNFNTVMSGEAPPIDAKQKFHLFFKSSVDPFQFVAAGADALFEQALDSYPEYHQGFKGYSKRYGAAFADGFDGNFFGNAVLPSIFHQDPRYFRMGHGTFRHRFWYALSTTVMCKGDNGNWQFNYSNLAGNFIGGAISNVYYPAADRGFGLTMERGATVSAEGALGSLAVEFYPDVMQHFRNRRKVVVPAASAPATPPQP
jgi:hypothetical protein